MKKALTIALLVFSMGVSAFWNWNDNDRYYHPYGGYGYYDDNGIFGYNPYDFPEPDWWFEEMENFMDEFDDDDWGGGPYRYGHHPYGGYGRPYYGGYGRPYYGGPRYGYGRYPHRGRYGGYHHYPYGYGSYPQMMPRGHMNNQVPAVIPATPTSQ